MSWDFSYLLDSTVLSSLVFLVCTLVLFYKTAKKVDNIYFGFFIITAFVLLTWFFAVIFLSRTGFFAKNPLFAPFIFIGFLVIFQGLLMVYRSERIRKIADKVPQHWLIGIQTYRIVGVGFIFLYFQGILPGAFAFPSGIGDILVGVSAPFVAWAFYKKKEYSRRLAIIWNIIGIADLVIALSVGFLGFPRPARFVPLNPSTEPLSLFPLAVITLFAVPLAILMHSFSLRVLRNSK